MASMMYQMKCRWKLRNRMRHRLKCEGLLYRFCADSVRYQRASSVTALGKKYYEQGRQMKAAEFAPMYLRLSQAERERMEKENITTRS